MKLPKDYLDLTQQLYEFDIWVTPSLGNITDTEKFKDELNKVVRVFDAFEETTNFFESLETCNPRNIAKTFSGLISGISENEREEILCDLASTLFLVTGKSDNNFKCQFPLYLRDKLGVKLIPQVRGSKRKTIANRPLPRVIKSDDFMKLIAKLNRKEFDVQLLEQIISFLLNGEKPSSQFWSIGKGYSILKQFDKQKDLLTPLVIFKVRGSVTASGGHEPEDKLRDLMNEWGLEPGIDYNLNDVVVNNASSEKDKKTRAFDFVVPYKTEGWKRNWEQRLFIQCQFYAGDSGSVSHKVVDQTQSSRASIAPEIPDAKFIEYLDGAGYFSSLNGDLRKMLVFNDTYSFFQVRTSPIRLRRSLQQLGFVTPLEIEHSILSTDGSIEAVSQKLVTQGYPLDEIKRSIQNTISRQIVECDNNRLTVKQNRMAIIRKYILLDVTAIHGSQIDFDNDDGISGYLLVPGYGAFYGLSLDQLVEKTIESAPSLKKDFSNTITFMGDIKALCASGFALSR